MHASNSRHVSVCVLLAKYEIGYCVQSLGIIYNAKNPRQSIKKNLIFSGHFMQCWLFVGVLLHLTPWLIPGSIRHGAYY